MKCSCGGRLRPAKLDEFDLTGVTALGEIRVRGIDGFRCDRCGEATISGATMARVELALVCLILGVQRRLLGQEIRFLREWMGLTQAESAERLGINRVTLANWERGHRPVSRSGDYMLRSLVVGRVVGQALLPAKEQRRLASQALSAVSPDILPDEPEPYIIAAESLGR